MRNKYAGTCYRCGKRVEVGEGHFEKTATGWRTQHASCAIKYRGTDHGHDLETPAVPCPDCGHYDKSQCLHEPGWKRPETKSSEGT